MINGRLTTGETAERLGVKPATVYAYVSRGLLHPERGRQGSTFDRREVALLARSARQPGGPGRATAPLRSRSRTEVEAGGSADQPPGRGDPVFVTELTLIDGGRLYYRGRDAVELSRSWSFERVAEWLWTGRDGGPETAWPASPAPAGDTPSPAGDRAGAVLPVERFMVATVAASLQDQLRHDLDPERLPATGRALLRALAASLPLAGQAPQGGGAAGRSPSMAEDVWAGLTGRPADAGARSVLDGALVLSADHELAPSTLAARVAASFRADPYAVVLTGLGPSAGSWPAGSTGAPGEVEAMLARAATVGAERALGEQLRRSGETPHGFGMPLYPHGDPRGRELLARLSTTAPPERWEVVQAVIDVAAGRGFPAPNFDLGLGALSFCSRMVPGAGQAIFTFAKVAGWLAHAMEEYADPTRFRIRADYVGASPDGTPGSS